MKFRTVPADAAGYTGPRYAGMQVVQSQEPGMPWFDVGDPLPEADARERLRACEETKVRAFDHTRKGRLTGVVVSENDEWLDLFLVGDHDPKRMYLAVSNRTGADEVITVRKSMLTEVAPS